jgi:hypothetical protein
MGWPLMVFASLDAPMMATDPGLNSEVKSRLAELGMGLRSSVVLLAGAAFV